MAVTARPEPVLLFLNIVLVAAAGWALASYLEDFSGRYCALGPASAQLTAFGLTLSGCGPCGLFWDDWRSSKSCRGEPAPQR